MTECEETWFTDKMSHVIVPLRVCRIKLLFHLLPESVWSLPMAWREANMMSCSLPASWFIHSWSVHGSSSHRRKNIYFFLFLRGFFSHLLILFYMSLCLCQQMSQQLDLTFLCSLADKENVWPWWLLLCKVRQALPLPCMWCINLSALALCMCFRINTESSYSISLFLLFLESNLTGFLLYPNYRSPCSNFSQCLLHFSQSDWYFCPTNL